MTASWQMRGTTLEACNCDPICPCRQIDGVAGGRSAEGVCEGALSWVIIEGSVGDVDLAGLAVVIVLWYDDDEPRSPWHWVLHVDDRGDERQRAALEDVFAGRLGGTPAEQFPWVFKPSDLLAVVPSTIEIDHTPGRGWFRTGRSVTMRIAGPYATESTVSCIIPGHHRAGRELVSEIAEVENEHFRFRFEGKCGYESTFEYSSG